MAIKCVSPSKSVTFRCFLNTCLVLYPYPSYAFLELFFLFWINLGLIDLHISLLHDIRCLVFAGFYPHSVVVVVIYLCCFRCDPISLPRLHRVEVLFFLSLICWWICRRSPSKVFFFLHTTLLLLFVISNQLHNYVWYCWVWTCLLKLLLVVCVYLPPRPPHRHFNHIDIARFDRNHPTHPPPFFYEFLYVCFEAQPAPRTAPSYLGWRIQ